MDSVRDISRGSDENPEKMQPFRFSKHYHAEVKGIRFPLYLDRMEPRDGGECHGSEFFGPGA